MSNQISSDSKEAMEQNDRRGQSAPNEMKDTYSNVRANQEHTKPQGDLRSVVDKEGSYNNGMRGDFNRGH